MQGLGHAAEHAEGVAFVAGRLKAADLLLGGLEKLRKVLLGKSSLLAQRGNLQRHIPRFARLLKAGGKRRVLQLSFEIAVEIGSFHCSALFRQSRTRSRAASSSRAGIACPLLRTP